MKLSWPPKASQREALPHWKIKLIPQAFWILYLLLTKSKVCTLSYWPHFSAPDNIPAIFIGNSTIEWVSKSQLLGMTIDEKLTWTPHVLELKTSFAKRLGLLIKKSRFLPRNVQWLMVLYCKDLAAIPTYFSPWKDFIVGLRDLFLICRKTWHLLMSYNGPNGQLCPFIINQTFLSVFMKLSLIGYLLY